ncbi:phage tail protein [Streptomyces hoynatensis]|uniref:Phage tail protein n=1 Tax=Streptomyces hoynatensis TaxID=1141874 RepID=A0A3A9Z707_9ACTN|nr:phage tail protein [Streptomyces hoynatensis]
MRGLVPGLPSPHPLAAQLPAVYADHDFLRRFLGALDEVLAPVLLTLDNLPAYLHPRTAPEDFLAWIAGWVAVEVDGERPLTQRRAVVSGAVLRHRMRGTRAGLAAVVRIETGAEPEITESGGTAWSASPGSPAPGSARPSVTVTLRVAEPGRVDLARLEHLVAEETPAHVASRVEILPLGGAPGAGEGGDGGGGDGPAPRHAPGAARDVAPGIGRDVGRDIAEDIARDVAEDIGRDEEGEAS